MCYTIPMSTKNKVLDLLESTNEYLSGESIASQLNVSRASIWKAIKSLQKEGYHIVAIPNKGYKIEEDFDVLSYDGIKKYLHVECDLEVKDVVTSTNTVLSEKANQGAKDGLVVVSGMQTNGKGRMGHTFHSPQDTGVYLSVLLRPKNMSPMEATNITSMAAVSGCEAIEKLSKENAQIKWINDIFIKNRKVAGILTEASINMELVTVDYVIMGIGFNVYTPEDGFPEEIKNIADSILKKKIYDGRNQLAAYFINSFLTYYKNWNKEEYHSEYVKRSMVLNKEIWIDSAEGIKKVFAKDIDQDFQLVIIDNGIEKKVSSGEVHIKL